MHLNRFKYAIERGIMSWRQTDLYTNLDDALLAANEFNRITLVPAGHEPWRPLIPEDKRPPAPLAYLGAWCWVVVCERRYHDGEKPFEHFLGELADPCDAFALAQLKQKESKDRGEKRTRYFVALWAYAENRCRPELARMPADHLSRLRREAERRRRLVERRKAKLAA